MHESIKGRQEIRRLPTISGYDQKFSLFCYSPFISWFLKPTVCSSLQRL